MKKNNPSPDRLRSIQPSEPYVPSVRVGELVGRLKQLSLLTAAWMTTEGGMPLAPLLVGPPGVGKNRLVYEIAHCTGRDLYIMQGHEDVTAEDLACAVRFSDSGSGMEYVLSPLVTAMQTGGICFIDEIGKVRPRALALVVSVLDERRYIDSTLLGARIKAHVGFRFVAATNTGELNALPEFIRSRMRPIIHVGYPDVGEINEIIRRQFRFRFDEMQGNLNELLETFWTKWQKLEGQRPTPRDAIQLFALASSLADYDHHDGDKLISRSSRDDPLPLISPALPGTLRSEHIERAFEELFAPKAV